MERPKIDFVRLPDAYGSASSDVRRVDLALGGPRIVGWSSVRIPDGYLDSPLREPGDLLARLWSLHGPPGSGEPDAALHYTFLDARSGAVFSPHAWKADPSYGFGGVYLGPLPPPPEPDARALADRRRRPAFLEAVGAFESVLADAPLADCALVESAADGLRRVGARNGHPFHESLTFVEAIDFCEDLARRFGFERDAARCHLARPEEAIRWLWAGASPQERARRPGAVDPARRAWHSALEALERTPIARSADRATWRLAWRALDEQASLVGADTAEHRRRLDGLREPPPVPPEVARQEMAMEVQLVKLLRRARAQG